MLIRTFHYTCDPVIFMRPILVLCIVCPFLFVSASSAVESIITPISLNGYRVESEDAQYNKDALAYYIPTGRRLQIQMFGGNLNEGRGLLFTKQPSSENVTCDSMDHTSSFELFDSSSNVARADVLIDSGTTDEIVYFMCVRDKNGRFQHLGHTSKVVVFYKSEHIMPLPIQVALVTLCLFLSSIFSGLNLGLMSLDVGELKLIIKCGSSEDKKYAKAILPIRRRGNTLLCTLLFGNTIVNASCTLLLDDLIGQGIFALFGSTIGILIFGEIVPQSICSRYGLRVGYYCRFIVLFFMFALFPVTFAVGKLLDLLLGREIHQVYSRDKLREIVKMSFQMDGDSRSSSMTGLAGRSGLKREEVNIVTGALEITEASVKNIMKNKDSIFMLDINSAIDYDLIELITRHGYTRIPIYANGDRNNIVGLLSTKDLLGIDPEDKLPLNSVIEFYPRSILRVVEETTILDVLNLFKTSKVHLAIVDRIVCDEEHDPTKEMVGIVTLEDVIEFILREEINDEADDLKERRHKEEQADTRNPQQSLFKRADTIPQQLNTAAVQFLIANVEAFRKEIVERKVLANLLRFPGIFVVKKFGTKYATQQNDNALYSADKEVDYFVLVLQGSCQVFIGRERLPFEAGPFHYFGLEALIGNSQLSASHHHLGHAAKSSLASVLTEDGNINTDLTAPHTYRMGSYMKGPGAAVSSTSVHRVVSRSGSQSSLGSVHPAYQYSRKTFVPDFTVEITQDVQLIRLTNAHYRALLTVSQLVRRKEKLDDTSFIIEKLWLELVREGEQFPSFELVTPPRISMPVNLPAESAGSNASVMGSTKITPPNSSSMLPLRLSVTNLHHESPSRSLTSGRDASQNEFQVGSQPTTPHGGAETSLGTPSRSRSPLQSALLNSSRNDVNRLRSATASEAEPLLAVHFSQSPDPSFADDSAVVIDETASRTPAASNDNDESSTAVSNSMANGPVT